MIVKIDRPQYEECEKAAANMWCSSKGGVYGKGLLNSIADPYRTERIGRLGEMALCKVINTSPDFSYRKFGDAGDFVINNKKIDIKTAARNYGEMLVCGENEWGKKVDIKSDIYVAAVILKDDTTRKESEVDILGWCRKDVLIAGELVPARKGRHQNYVMRYTDLTDIDELVKLIEGKRL